MNEVLALNKTYSLKEIAFSVPRPESKTVQLIFTPSVKSSHNTYKNYKSESWIEISHIDLQDFASHEEWENTQWVYVSCNSAGIKLFTAVNSKHIEDLCKFEVHVFDSMKDVLCVSPKRFPFFQVPMYNSSIHGKVIPA